MVKYRRYYVPGGTYFFTLTLHDRKSDYLVRYIKQIKEAMQRVNQIHPYKTLALVVLPDHLHAMWELPENDANFSLRWRCIKTQFTKDLIRIGVQIKKILAMNINSGKRDFGSAVFVMKSIMKTM